jgi:hypothetical protein
VRIIEAVAAEPRRTIARGIDTTTDIIRTANNVRRLAWLRLKASVRACSLTDGRITQRPWDLLLGGVVGAIIFIPLRNRSAAGRGAVCLARIAAGTNTAIQATPKMARNQMVKPCFPV